MTGCMHRTLSDILRGDPDLWAAALQAVLLAAVLVPGQVPWSGPVLLSLTATHGVHLGDLAVVALWLLVLAAAGQRGLLRDLAGLPGATGSRVLTRAAHAG